MTTSLAALFVLFTATTDSTPAAPSAQDRTVEITITGPEAARAAVEEAVRTLVGDHPDLRWTSRERGPDELPSVNPGSASNRRIWVDLAHPIAVHIYLPGCSSNGSESVRTVESDPGDEAGVVERETVAQIVKGALEGLHCAPAPAAPVPAVGPAKPAPAFATEVAGRRAGAFWLGLGAGVAWGYVPSGHLEWRKNIKVVALTEMAGLFHLLPEVGYMVSDGFALAVQGRLELIKQEQGWYIEPTTGERVDLSNMGEGDPSRLAYAGLLRAIWYPKLSASRKLRLSLSGDLGAGLVRFPVGPQGPLIPTADGTLEPNAANTIPRTDTRPMGMLLFGGSVGLLWHLTHRLALAFETRVLSGLPDWGFVIEGQASFQAAFGGAGAGSSVK
jgi:hypothetical protein